MKTLLILVVFMQMLFIKVNSQTVERLVVSTSGGSGHGRVYIDYTFGETFFETSESENIIMTNGFQQPLLKNNSGIITQEDKAVIISVFPNPVTDVVCIEFDEELAGSINVEVFDITGNSIMEKKWSLSNASTKVISIDMSSFALGTYLVRINKDFVKLKDFMIVKISSSNN